MPELRVVAFDRVSLALVIHRLMLAPVAEFAAGVEGVREVAARAGRGVNDSLHHFRRAPLADRVRGDTPGRSFDDRDDKYVEDFLPIDEKASGWNCRRGLIIIKPI